jgi:hypothetical protein
MPRSRVREITREELGALAARHETLDGVCQALGLAPCGRTYDRIRQRAESLGLDSARWRSRWWLCGVPDAEFRTAVERARSLAELLRVLGAPGRIGNHYQTVYRRLRRLGLPTPHWVRERVKATPLTDLLRPGRTYGNMSRLKRKLLDAGILRDECYACGIGPVWNGHPLMLQLDHVNGVDDDNSPDNLRLLCPNCHSQTPTFAGRNRGAAERRREYVAGRQQGALGASITQPVVAPSAMPSCTESALALTRANRVVPRVVRPSM